MMKFFRKHNRKLIAILMSLLMIVFIGGSALEGMLTTNLDRVVAESDLGPITYVDQQSASGITELLSSLGMDWQRPVGIAITPLEEVDWILLTREAERMGTTVDESNVRSTVTSEQIDTFARLRRTRPDTVVEAIRQFQSVQQTALMVGAAAAPSEAEIRDATRNALETVRVNAVVLPAKAMVDYDATITEEEFAAHFEEYRDKEAGSGLTFGYYLHPAVKVQFVKINRAKIAEQIGIANLNKKARRYYDKERENNPVFRRPADELHDDPTGMGPSHDRNLRWSEAKEKAIDAVRNREAERKAARIANWMIDYASAGMSDGERGDSGYREAPENVRNLDYYRTMLEQIPTELKFEGAVRVWVSNLFTRVEASDVTMIGSSSYRPERGIPIPFSDLAFRTQAIVPKVPTDKENAPSSYTAIFQTCPYPVSDAASGDVYVFRVVQAREGRPAGSLNEVREMVEQDIRLKRAYESAMARAEGLVGCLGEKNLREAYESDEELVALRDTVEGMDSGYFEPIPFSRASTSQAIQGRSNTGKYISGVGLIPDSAVDRCFALENEIEKADILELRDRAAILVAEWVDTTPPEEERFNQTRLQVLNQISNLRWRDAVSDWLDPQQIRARNGFKLVGS